MSLYNEYIAEIETRKTQGLSAKPIDDGGLIKEIISHIKDANSLERADCLQFFYLQHFAGYYECGR
jgi:aconitate hydratase 2/2-methylisocitrate dehydratase